MNEQVQQTVVRHVEIKETIMTKEVVEEVKELKDNLEPRKEEDPEVKKILEEAKQMSENVALKNGTGKDVNIGEVLQQVSQKPNTQSTVVNNNDFYKVPQIIPVNTQSTIPTTIPTTIPSNTQSNNPQNVPTNK
jgi:hypothetical protein